MLTASHLILQFWSASRVAPWPCGAFDWKARVHRGDRVALFVAALHARAHAKARLSTRSSSAACTIALLPRRFDSSARGAQNRPPFATIAMRRRWTASQPPPPIPRRYGAHSNTCLSIACPAARPRSEPDRQDDNGNEYVTEFGLSVYKNHQTIMVQVRQCSFYATVSRICRRCCADPAGDA